MRELPSGQVTFLFTDVEGSTRLLQELGAAGYADALGRHRELLRAAFAAHGGVEVDTQGDAFFYAFASPAAAVAAAADGRDALDGPIRVRMGLHTGSPHVTEEGYVGEDVHLGARVAGVGHGGQVLLSRATRELVDDGVADLGEHRLKDFAEPVWIFQLGSERFPPLKTISNTNLPRPASSFVGRERETAELAGLVRGGARLVTLTGPGGSGKTRLAIEAAAELVPEFRNGVFWVGLASLRDPALVAETVAQTLGAKDGLAAHVGERELLLLLDNLEHVIDAAPELAELLESCPNLHMLVTSRELLRVRGEVEYAVAPLADREAMELFCARSGLPPDETVAELCRRLDRLPLAVELAAARTSVLSPAQIEERLSQRLDLLKGGRDADPRQQTLRATIEWSHDLLSPEEQELLAGVSVFAGGCTLEAAEQVAGADLDTLQSLVEKSLLRRTGERFWLLETVREYALERLASSHRGGELHRRHAWFFSELLELAEPALHGPEQLRWLERLAAEHDNVRAALGFAGEADTLLMLRLAAGASWFWLLRSHLKEGCAWLAAALEAAPAASASLRAAALDGWGKLAYYHTTTREGDEAAAALLAQAVELRREAGDAPELARSLAYLALTAGSAGDAAGARAAGEEAIAVSAAADDWTRALALWAHGANIILGLSEGAESDQAGPLLEESAALFRRCGDAWGLGAPLFYLGRIALRADGADAARPLLVEALECFRSIGDKWRHSLTARELAKLIADDSPAAALALYEEAAELFEELGNEEETRAVRAQIERLRTGARS